MAARPRPGGTIISGNIDGSTGSGITIGTGNADNLIEGNYIGTNAAGTAAIPNANSGIDVQGSSGNTIGGATTTAGTGVGNVISGNTASGITLEDSAAGNIVLGNIIGLDYTGTRRLETAAATAATVSRSTRA